MNKTKSKKKYVKAWEDYTKALWALALNPDDKLSKEVATKIKELMLLIPKVADAKGLK